MLGNRNTGSARVVLIDAPRFVPGLQIQLLQPLNALHSSHYPPFRDFYHNYVAHFFPHEPKGTRDTVGNKGGERFRAFWCQNYGFWNYIPISNHHRPRQLKLDGNDWEFDSTQDFRPTIGGPELGLDKIAVYAHGS